MVCNTGVPIELLQVPTCIGGGFIHGLIEFQDINLYKIFLMNCFTFTICLYLKISFKNSFIHLTKLC